MRVWEITEDHSMRLTERETPAPGAGEVRVRVEGVGINRADIIQVLGNYPAPAGVDPSVPGLEYSGIVDAVGPKVLGRSVGERVMGLVAGEAYAEYIVTHESTAIPVPECISAKDAGGVAEAFLTAYRSLFQIAGLAGGQTCLIRPATSAVGLAGVQLAVAHGVRVIGSSREPARLDLARAYGLWQAVSESDEMSRQVRSHTGGVGADVLLDMVGEPFWRSLNAVGDEGAIVLIGAFGGRESYVDLGEILRRRLRIQGMTMRSLDMGRRSNLARLFEHRLTPLFMSGVLKPLPTHRYRFEDANKAHEDMLLAEEPSKRILWVA